MILDEIVARKREELRTTKRERPIELLAAAPGYAQPRRSLAASLTKRGRRIIAELKRSSPSRGRLRRSFDPGVIASAYESAGAAAVSVLTEENWFEGSVDHLEAVRGRVEIPILRKDFIFDPYQVHEARTFGADAILLIVRILSDEELGELLAEARAADLETLLEVHDREDLERALRPDVNLIGINNRDLTTLAVSLDTTLTLSSLVPAGKTVVAESGIKSGMDLRRLESAGVRAFLIGETFMESPDPACKLSEFLSMGKGAGGGRR